MTTVERNAFDGYHEEFCELFLQLQVSLQQQHSLTKEQQLSLFQQCQDLIKLMATEARLLSDASLKQDLLAQVKACESQLAAWLKQSLLLARGSSQPAATEQKQHLLLQQQHATLERALQSVHGTEEVAEGVTNELGQNRDKIQTTQARVQQWSGLVEQAGMILNSMTKR